MPKVHLRAAQPSNAPDRIGSHCVHWGGWFRIGYFRAPPTHPRWSCENCFGPAGIVFPRTAVEIAQADRAPVVAHPSRVMLYDDHQIYRARIVSERGDECEWFAPSPQALRAAAREVSEAFNDERGPLFNCACAPCTGQSYLLQRSIFEHAMHATSVDALWVEEAFARVLHDTLTQAWAVRPGATRNLLRKRAAQNRVTKNHYELMVETSRLLSARLSESVQLTSLASELNVSLFHLCRVFREAANISIHACLTRMRLARSLEILTSSAKSISQVALEVGFSSQSHFNDAFRQHYAASPAAWRRAITGRKFD